MPVKEYVEKYRDQNVTDMTPERLAEILQHAVDGLPCAKPEEVHYFLATIGRLQAEVARLTQSGKLGGALYSRRKLEADLTASQARVAELEAAGSALIGDVRRRYPGEDLRCPFMIALDAAIKGAKP